MMTKKATIFILLILSFNGNTQISIDSLLLKISSHYSKTGIRKYLGETFTIFETENKKDRYDLFLDSNNKLQENIGLSVVHYSYDELNRIILIEGFNKSGKRSYWDFPEVQVFRYVSDTIVSDFNKIRNEICNCKNQDTLSDMVIIKEINSDTIYNKIRISIFSKDSTMKLTYSICSNGKICNRSENASYIFRQFDKKVRYLIVHERYYDRKLRLVNGRHQVFQSENVSYSARDKPYAYSIRELEKGEIKTIRFYNKTGKIVGVEEYIISGPVNVPK